MSLWRWARALCSAGRRRSWSAPLRRCTRGFYFIMVTLAAGQMMFSLFHDTDIAKGSDGAFVNVKPELAFHGMSLLDFSDWRQFYYVCLVVLVAAYFALLGWSARPSAACCRASAPMRCA